MTVSGLGPYPIAVTVGSNPNYSVTSTDAVLTVNQAVATVVADAKAKFYGQANPLLTAVVTGQVAGGDAVNYTLATAAAALSSVGPYPIAVTLGSNRNASVTASEEMLAVNQSLKKNVADAKGKFYGQANPLLTAVVTGRVAGGD